MSDPTSSPGALSQVPGVVPVSSVAGPPPATIVGVSKGLFMVNLLTNRSFQMWTFAILFTAGLIVLMAIHALTTGTGMPMLTAVAGFMLGVPVSPTSSQ